MIIALKCLYSIIALLLPFVVSAFPFILFMKLKHFSLVNESAFMLFLSTLVSVLVGYVSTWLAVSLSAELLSYMMKGDGPKCVTGVVIYFASGGFFTLSTLLVGSGMAANQAFRKQV